MGHASPSTTLNIYAHMFDEARHAADIRARMARSAFAGLLDADDEDERGVVTLPAAARSNGGPPFRSSTSRDQVGNLTET